jgi:hypothetical protein
LRIHHLNCGSLCPRGGKLFGGAGGPLSPAPMCCHCLLIEGDDGLILVDSGLGVEDVNEPRRLGFLFNAMVRPRLDVAETALRQVADMGFRPRDVRHIVPTHLDLDHAGGICDFPDAAVHVFADELRAASQRSTFGEQNRYRKAQIAAVKKWAAVEEAGETWFGFSAVRAIPGMRDEVLLVPLPFARALRRRHIRRGRLVPTWRRLFPSLEIGAEGGAAPKGVRFFESMVQFDGAQRRANQARLRELARLAIGEVKLICSHDVADFAAMESEAREARPALRLFVRLGWTARCAGRRVRPCKATLVHRGDRRFPLGFGPRQHESVRPGCLAPQRLDRAAARLVVDAAHSGGACRPRGKAPLWPDLSFNKQVGQPGSRVLAVAGLARGSGQNDDDAARARAPQRA